MNRIACRVLVVPFYAALLAIPACSGCRAKKAKAPAPAAAEADTTVEEPVAEAPVVPADPIAVETRKVAEKYWSAVAESDVPAIRALIAGNLAAQFADMEKKGGIEAITAKLHNATAMRPTGPGSRVSDDEYQVRCRARSGPNFTVALTIKKVGGDWKVTALRPLQMPH